MKSCKIIASLFLLISVAAFGADHTDWTYDAEKNTLTSYDVSDTTKIVWQFVNVTCDGNMLTISRLLKAQGIHIAPSEASSLDFSKQIIGTDSKTYYLKKFAWYDNAKYNLFNNTSTEGSQAPKVSNIILPKTFDIADAGTIQYFKNATKFEFYGDYKIIEARTFYSCYGCRSIIFHQFPPKASNNNANTLKQCGHSNATLSYYRYCTRFEYPKFLESAWLNTTHKTDSGVDCALYNVKLTNIPSNYTNSFPDDTEGPDGFAWINYYSNAWTGQVALKAFDEKNPTDKVVLGVMGLPYEISQEAMKQKDYEYGYHEYDVGNNGTKTLPIARPKRFVKIIDEEGVEKWYTCVGYKLFKDSNAVDDEIETNTPDEIIPFDQDVTVGPGNYGLTWIWEEGAPGFRITIR